MCAIVAGVSAQYLPYPQAKQLQPQQIPLPYLQPQKSFASAPGGISSYLPLIQKYVPGASLALPPGTEPSAIILTQQQLPKAQAPAPFYSPQPSTVLKPPQGYSVPNNNYYNVPVPSQELQVPSQVAWNPDNDPRYYYNSPSNPVREDTPTNLHPKKYDKQLHATAKPYVKAKDAGAYSNQQDGYKLKTIEKTKQNLAKHENQKRVKAEKVQKQKVKSKSELQAGSKNEPQAAASGYYSGYDHEGYGQQRSPGFSEGLNSQLRAALQNNRHQPKERLEFQLHGHDGPNSYKWGFDHGEG